jgi:hemerythrin-like domain-containing protein
MRDPFHQLMEEHRVIEHVLTAIEKAARRDVPASFYEQVLDFVDQFTDGYHHAKEEERLFTYLEERGMPRDIGPLGVMLHEHDVGRGHVRAMKESLAADDIEALRMESLAYAVLMRDHIAKEDDVLFPMGRAMLTPEEIEEIQEGFDTVTEPAPSAADYAALAAGLLASQTETS